MSTLFKREIQRALEEIEGIVGDNTFTWKSIEIPCTPSTLQRGVVIDIGGNPEEISLTLIVRRSHFLTADSTLVTVDSDLYTTDNDTPVPVARRTVIFRGATYRILSAKESAPQSHLELHLADPHSGRT